MSIITNAIKKAQSARQKDGINSAPVYASPSFPQKKKNPLFKALKIILAVMLLFGGISYLLLNTKSHAPLSPLAQIVNIPATKNNLPEPPAQEPDIPTLSGIMYSLSTPQAVIDGTMVSEGNSVGKFSIIKILPDKVVITSGEKEFELQLR
ncbi:MAG: hypothetical protein ABH844_01610 [Candidatus Omnitrophota bacterium]